MPQTHHRPIEILLIEDNPADTRLTEEALKEAKIAINLHPAGNGRAALDFLHRRGTFADAPQPDLILLDLNLPGISGHAVLTEIKNDPDLRQIPVVVLTSSEAESDVIRAYQEHANCFVSKPVDFSGFLHIVHAVEGFWFSVVKLPSNA